MTRGIIAFIGRDKKVYVTREFNGDMYTAKEKGHGLEIVNHFRQGGFKSESEYERFVVRFDRKYFHYAGDSDENLIFRRALYNKAMGFCIKDNITDYLYLINGSGTKIRIVSKGSETVIPVDTMAVIHYDAVECVIERGGSQEQVPISEIEFVNILEKLQKSNDMVDEIDTLIRKNRADVECEFCSGSALRISHESAVVRLLEVLMRDLHENISYFIYELDYGRNYKPGMVTDSDGEIDLSSAHSLYQFLVRENFEEDKAACTCADETGWNLEW